MPLGASITEVYSLRAGGDDDPGALWVGTRTSGLLRLEPRPGWRSTARRASRPTRCWVFSRRRDRERPAGLLDRHRERARGDPRQPADDRGRAPRVCRDRRCWRSPSCASAAGRARSGRRSSASGWCAASASAGSASTRGRRSTRTTAPGCSRRTPPDGAAVLWVGTERSGLARMERGRWTRAHQRRTACPRTTSSRCSRPRRTAAAACGSACAAAASREIVDGRVVASWNRGSGPAERRRDVAGRGAAARRTARGLGGHAGGRRAARRRRRQRRWARLGSGLGPAAAERDGALDRPGQGRAASTLARSAASCGSARAGRRPGQAEFDAEVFGLADGLPSATANWGQLRDSLGRIWIATTGGVALFDPSREATFRAPPAPLVLESARVADGGTRDRAGRARSRPQERDVSLRVRAAHAAPRRRGALPHAAPRLRRGALAVVARSTRRATRTCPRAATASGSRRARASAASAPVELAVHAARPHVAAAVGDRARGAGRDRRGRRAAALPRARAAPARRGPRVARRRAHAPALGGELAARRARASPTRSPGSRTADGSRRTPRKSGAAARAAARASRS